MKAIILAAGKGTRLGGDVPKPLTPLIVDYSIMHLQVEKISEVVGRENIIVVVGYEKEHIMNAFPDLQFAHNDEFEDNNTAKSLLKGLDMIEGDDVIWMNGDVYFDKNVLTLLKSVDGTICLVDTKNVSDEEIKYTLKESGHIHDLSKEVPHDDAVGEGLGINRVAAGDLENFKSELRAVGEKDYFEKALEQLAHRDEIEITPVDIGDLFCHEIDFPEDLAYVREHLDDVGDTLVG